MELLPLYVMFLILFLFMGFGVPIAFAFGVANILTLIFFVGIEYSTILYSACFASLGNFLYIALPLFILLGELFHYSGVAEIMINILKKWVRLPGSLGITSIVGCGIFGAISGSGMAACAAFGSIMIRPMLKAGYPKGLATGIIVFGGLLDFFIPPNAITVVYAVLAGVSISKMLIGTVVPGVVLTILAAIYVSIRMKFVALSVEEEIAKVAKVNYRELLIDTAVKFLPLLLVVFAVTVTIYMGIATPSEAAAAGVVMSVIVIAFYRKLSVKVVHSALLESMVTTGMIFFIMVGSTAFSQLLFFTGTSQKIISLIVNADVSTFTAGIILCSVVLILSCFIDVISVMFITLPVFNPVIESLHFDKTWFGLIYLYCIALGAIKPPFGVNLFVTKSVSPPEVTLQDVYVGILPFLFIALVVLAVFYVFPDLITWLPNKVSQ